MSNIRIVQDFIAAWEARDLDRVMSFFAADAVYHNIPMPVLTGVADIRNFIGGFIGMGEAIQFETHHIAETAAGAVMTERTDMFLINGQKLVLPVMGTFEIKDDKITRWRDYFDLQQFETQLAKITGSK